MGGELSVIGAAWHLRQNSGIRDHLRQVICEQRLLAEPNVAKSRVLEQKVADFLSATSPPHPSGQSPLALIQGGHLGADEISLELSREGLAEICQIEKAEIASAALRLHVPISMQRRATGSKLAIGAARRQPDPKLVAALARAHRWLAALRGGEDITSLAARDGISAGCLRGHLQLAFLAPSIQRAILDGTQPASMTVHSLTRPEMPADWALQYERTGFSPS